MTERPKSSEAFGEGGWPAVTCLCPTYGRFEKLRLALACFLAQDYPGEKHLLILNDSGVPIELPEDGENPLVDTHLAAYGIHASRKLQTIVINQDFVCPNLGAKRQALLGAADTPLVAHWDDDDLYLPWHLTRSVGALLAHRASCVKSRGAWYVVGSFATLRSGASLRSTRPSPSPTPPAFGLSVRGIHHNIFEGTMAFWREAALDLGGYPPLHSGQAKALMDAFDKAGRLYKIPDGEGGGPSYVYRWADGVGHISGIGNRADTAAKFKAQNRDFGGGQPLTPGDLTPYWDALRAAGCLALPSDATHKSYRTHQP